MYLILLQTQDKSITIYTALMAMLGIVLLLLLGMFYIRIIQWRWKRKYGEKDSSDIEKKTGAIDLWTEAGRRMAVPNKVGDVVKGVDDKDERDEMDKKNDEDDDDYNDYNENEKDERE